MSDEDREKKKNIFSRIASKRASTGEPLETPSDMVEVVKQHLPENPVTLEQLKEIVPKNIKPTITQNLVDDINQISHDPIHAEVIRENIIRYTNILEDGNYRIKDYVNAVQYASYKLMKYSNLEAYKRTFPDRYTDMKSRGVSEKDISSYVAAVHKGQLVQEILKKAFIPVWLLNQDYFQEALDVAVGIMRDEDVSPKVRVEAASAVMANLQQPKEATLNLKVESPKENEAFNAVKDSILHLAEMQRQAIESGAIRTVDVAAMKIINPKE